MRRFHLLEVAASVMLAMTAGACGGGGGEVSQNQPEADVEEAAGPAGTEACRLVSQEDASALFGQPASADSGPSTPGMHGQCLWTWDTDTSNQLLQFHIWDRIAYDAPEDSEPLDLGEEGYVRAHPMAGVDIAWIDGNRMLSLSYSTVGPDAPEAASKVEEMKALARQVASRR